MPRRKPTARRAGEAAARPEALAGLLHRRWALPVLAELARTNGCKLVWLERHLGAGRGPARDALDALIALELAAPNPGYGHPMRPEYLPTSAGRSTGDACAAVLAELERLALTELGLRKWTLPILAAAAGIGARKPADRFGTIRAALPSATDRAVSLALKDLEEHGLIERTVVDGSPPRASYGIGGRAAALVGALGALVVP